MILNTPHIKPTFTSTRNACKLCAPLGASVVFKGIKGCIPLIHGSQGCATYIRRYMISHFKEPVDIASSNFSEATTIFGGSGNFIAGVNNIIHQYHPDVIGIASACLSETIGEDIPAMIKEYQKTNNTEKLPIFIHTSTPSYQGSHADGFHETVASTVSTLAKGSTPGNHINIFPGFVSPEDIRHLKDILDDFGIEYVLFPDYSDTLDNPHWKEYQLIPEGGTTPADIRRCGSAKGTLELGFIMNQGGIHGRIKNNKTVFTAGEWLERTFGVPRHNLRMPIGITETDKFFKTLETISGRPTPVRHQRERGRLIDSYIDGHKYLFGKRAVVFGDEDMVAGIVSFLEEIGIDTLLAASGGESGALSHEIKSITNDRQKDMLVMNNMDFETINDMVNELKPDLFIGNSKGYYITRRLGIPLVRVGFPIHDRFGAQRIQHLGYKGTQQLFDRITCALIEYKQEHSSVGYKYM